MSLLRDIHPHNVCRYFEEICAIPHGSGDEKMISDYLVNFAKERELYVRQDEALNVFIRKNASKGCENAKAVILQGHMDMVAVKDDTSSKNLKTDGIEPYVCGDMVKAKGTSLGADDGIAIAYILAILDDDNIVHPPIEAVFTTGEEIGMCGASAFDTKDVEGKILLNIDSEDEGVFTVSCAGGATVHSDIPIVREKVTGDVITFGISGLAGGHSGVEIDKGRANAIVVMLRILLRAYKECGYSIISIEGGQKDNAIPDECTAVIVADNMNTKAVRDALISEYNNIKREYAVTDKNMRMEVNVEPKREVMSCNADATANVIMTLAAFPDGVLTMSQSIKGLVMTSLNLGILRMSNDCVKAVFAIRSASNEAKEYVISKVEAVTKLGGGVITVKGRYPGWDYNKESILIDIMKEEYVKMYDNEPVVEGIHAGLECGVFASKIEGLDAVSYGPTIIDAHTTNESLWIPSIERTWKLTINVLRRLGEYNKKEPA